MIEQASKILESAGRPRFAVYVSFDGNGQRKSVESVGTSDMSEYAASLSDEQYECIARHVVNAMQAEAEKKGA